MMKVDFEVSGDAITRSPTYREVLELMSVEELEWLLAGEWETDYGQA
jgi:hypothetical protein